MKPQSLPSQLSRMCRIEPLAVLPVFLDLRDRHCLVIGGSPGALWKAELLMQAGAQITLVAPRVSAEVLDWSEKFQHVNLQVGFWQDIEFAGVSVVVADVEGIEVEMLAARARDAGALFNAVDKPEHCQFQFGSIINKSPLVIGISTGGAAPVLAQLVRGLLESALPQGVQHLARRAAKIRARVNARLKPGEARRRYWNTFFSQAFGKQNTENRHAAVSYKVMAKEVGDVTLRDLEMLRSAEVVVLHPKANPAVAALARREARRIGADTTRNLSGRGGLVVSICGVDGSQS